MERGFYCIGPARQAGGKSSSTGLRASAGRTGGQNGEIPPTGPAWQAGAWDKRCFYGFV